MVVGYDKAFFIPNPYHFIDTFGSVKAFVFSLKLAKLAIPLVYTSFFNKRFLGFLEGFFFVSC
jgi:hypothetical protein